MHPWAVNVDEFMAMTGDAALPKKKEPNSL
jgi:hypothetical protein